MQLRGCQNPRRAGVEEDEIGIGACLEVTLLRPQPEDLRRIGAEQTDKVRARDPLRYHAEAVHQQQRRLDPGYPRADLTEVVDARALREGKTAMVAAHALDRAARDPIPELRLALKIAKRWGHHVAGGIRLAVTRVIEHEVVRTGFGDRLDAAPTGLADQVNRQRGGDVDEVDGAAGHPAEQQAATNRVR